MTTAEKLPAPEPTNVHPLPVAAPTKKPLAVRTVEHPIPVYDTARFEHMQRIAAMMANAPLVPEHLRKGDLQNAIASCFLVVNQAANWDMDPFAVAQATYIGPGNRIGYEGKLIHAAIQKKLGIDLQYEFSGEGAGRAISVSGTLPGEDEPREIIGTFAQWHTKDKEGNVKGNWRQQPDDQLIYRGARQWCRRYAPGVILGVYSDDEIEDIETRARNARDVTPRADEPGEPVDPNEPEPPEPTPPEPTPPAAQPEPKPEPEAPTEVKAPMIEGEAVDVEAWLRDLEGAYAGCEDATQLTDAVAKYSMPYKGKVSPADYERAANLAIDAFRRISAGA
ncbi:MAG TPA: recombinase RecT [Pseudolabrys sp.]|nr:recombinase RecT [Pseudolabrys sp.]